MYDARNMIGRICLAVFKSRDHFEVAKISKVAFGLFPGEDQVPSQHTCHARNLLLLVHDVVAGHVGLEVKGHLPRHPGEDGEQVGGVGLPLKNVDQSLDEPAACRRVPPAVEARDCAVDYQKVRMIGNPTKIITITLLNVSR